MIRLAIIGLLLALSACETTGSTGCRVSPGSNSTHCLPSGPLDGIVAEVRVMSRASLDEFVRTRGYTPKNVNSVNEWTIKSGNRCTVYVADDALGFAAIEHGLWHCKLGDWHK